MFRVSIHCPFCRRHTSLEPAQAEIESGFQSFCANVAWQGERNDLWWIGVCNYCRKPVLVLNEGDTVYPHELPAPTDERIPDAIRNDIDEAKSCLNVSAWRAAVVMARRAIQTAAIEKGAPAGSKLVDQINHLASNGIITQEIKNWADVVRWVGNDGAHPGGVAVSQEDAEDILNLAEQLMNVIYVTPALAAARKQNRRPQ